MSTAPPLSSPPQTLARRLWRYAPLVLFIAFIFFNSTGAMSATSTGRILRPLLETLFGKMSDAQFGVWQLIVRKLAHFTEYAVLAWLAARAFATSSQTFLRRRWFALSLLLVAVCAALDEYHQSFVPSRTGSPYDTLIDICGGAAALLIFMLIRKRFARE